MQTRHERNFSGVYHDGQSWSMWTTDLGFFNLIKVRFFCCQGMRKHKENKASFSLSEAKKPHLGTWEIQVQCKENLFDIYKGFQTVEQISAEAALALCLGMQSNQYGCNSLAILLTIQFCVMFFSIFELCLLPLVIALCTTHASKCACGPCQSIMALKCGASKVGQTRKNNLKIISCLLFFLFGTSIAINRTDF